MPTLTGHITNRFNQDELITLEVDFGMSTITGHITNQYGKNDEIILEGDLGGGGGSILETIGIGIDGAGVVPSPGPLLGVFRRVDYAATILAWTIVADVSGSVQIDVWKTNLAGIASISSANSIVGSSPPTLVSSQTGTGDPTGWDTALAAGDFLGFNIDSIDTLTRVTLYLTLQRT